jgi:hypothetical protein
VHDNPNTALNTFDRVVSVIRQRRVGRQLTVQSVPFTVRRHDAVRFLTRHG